MCLSAKIVRRNAETVESERQISSRRLIGENLVEKIDVALRLGRDRIPVSYLLYCTIAPGLGRDNLPLRDNNKPGEYRT